VLWDGCETTKPFQVLAIDGGGIRGHYSTALLHSIAAHFEAGTTGGYEIGRHFDLIAGTSTGGILDCGLAAGKTTKELIALYREIGQKLFVDPQPDGKLATILRGWRNRKREAEQCICRKGWNAACGTASLDPTQPTTSSNRCQA
jgi:patatin-like phospholipase/acyl hydrolase